MSNIKPGYLLKIRSWENDADNYKTWEKNGLSEQEVRFYLLIAKLFRSTNDWTDKGFGNSEVPGYDEPDHVVEQAINNVVAGFIANGGVPPRDYDKRLEDPEWIEEYGNTFYQELVGDMIGIWNEGENYRVYESHTVHLVSKPILDVTTEFDNVQPA